MANRRVPEASAAPGVAAAASRRHCGETQRAWAHQRVQRVRRLAARRDGGGEARAAVPRRSAQHRGRARRHGGRLRLHAAAVCRPGERDGASGGQARAVTSPRQRRYRRQRPQARPARATAARACSRARVARVARCTRFARPKAAGLRCAALQRDAMLELGARVPVLLAHCAGSALSDAQVASLAAAAVGAVATGARAEAALGSAAAADVALREGLAGVATLVAEAARLSLTAAELRGTHAQSQACASPTLVVFVNAPCTPDAPPPQPRCVTSSASRSRAPLPSPPPTTPRGAPRQRMLVCLMFLTLCLAAARCALRCCARPPRRRCRG